MKARLQKLLGAIADISGDRFLLGLLVELAGEELKPEDRRYLAGPIIYHQTSWSETIPKWMFQQVAAERLDVVLGKLKMPVGPTEIAVVMYPATFVQHFDSNMTDLYVWASVNAVARHKKIPVREVWKQLGQRPVPDREVIERDGRSYQDYQSLAHEIRRKVENHQAQRERVERKNIAKSFKEEPKSAENDSVAIQLTMF